MKKLIIPAVYAACGETETWNRVAEVKNEYAAAAKESRKLRMMLSRSKKRQEEASWALLGAKLIHQ